VDRGLAPNSFPSPRAELPRSIYRRVTPMKYAALPATLPLVKFHSAPDEQPALLPLLPMSTSKPAHAPSTPFSGADDCLQIGGIPLTQLAQRIGRTPFFAYDRRIIAERVALLRRNLPRRAHLHYAIKANPMPEVVRLLAGLVDGL